jgi:predicted RNA-binding Zn-ribbon protein involved in translation (DUF1610 family)
MARSMKFFPPISLTQLSQEPVTLPSVSVSSSKPLYNAEAASVITPPLDLSKRAATLVHEAVSKPTVLPTSYTIPENIGDRISRLTAPKPVALPIAQPKIPQPDPNWTSADGTPALESAIDPSERAATLVREAVSQPTALPSSYTIPEDIGDRISRLTAPKPVESKTLSPKIPQPDSEGTSAQTIEPQPIETHPKKPIDDPHPEASTSAVAAAPTVEQTHGGDSFGAVVESLEVEETLDDEASATAIVEPVTVEKTIDDEGAAALVTEPIEVEETIDDPGAAIVAEPDAVVEATSGNSIETDTSVAEAEDDPTPTFLEKVSSAIQAASTAFKNPDVDRQDSKTVIESAPIDQGTTGSPAANTVEPSTTDAPALEAEEVEAPSLFERVSSAIEAVKTTFNDSDTDEKNRVSVESAPDKGVEITCPKCESTNSRKNGHRQGKQRYVCKDCGKEFLGPDFARAEDESEIKRSSPTSNVKGSQLDAAVSSNTSESSKRQSRKKPRAKGFGKS